MQETDYIWHNGQFVPWKNAKIHVLTHALHYGSGAFEGIRAYAAEQGTAIFKLDEHLKRLFYSANAIRMTLPYRPEELKEVIKELLRMNKLAHGYVRPIAYYGYGKMGVSPIGAPPELAIACWPWGAYLPHDMVDIKTSEYIRIPPRATVSGGKFTGYYLNGILGVLELQGTHYHEALFLDVNGFIGEGTGENFFMVKNNTLYTPHVSSALPGITRDTIMTLAKKFGHTVIEKDLTLEDAYGADETFFTGTAAEVTPIKSIDDKVIGNGTIGPVTAKIRETYLDIVHGRKKEFLEWLTFI
jgi:branched-chain amino acid aminotransferase